MNITDPPFDVVFSKYWNLFISNKEINNYRKLFRLKEKPAIA